MTSPVDYTGEVSLQVFLKQDPGLAQLLGFFHGSS